MGLTTRLRLPSPELDDPADGPDGFKDLANAIDFQAAIDDQGAFTQRPVSSPSQPGIRGRYYFATDQGVLYRDNGVGWNSVGFVGPDSITSIELAPDSVTSVELADNAVDPFALQDNAVQLRHMSDSSVGYPEMTDAVKPSRGATSTAETLRALGTAPGMAASGIHGPTHGHGGADQVVPRFVSSLVPPLRNGDEIYLEVDPSAVWHLRFNSAIGQWQFVGGGSLGGTAEDNYNRLADGSWSGPHVSLTIPCAGIYQVNWGGAGFPHDAGYLWGVAGPGVGLTSPQLLPNQPYGVVGDSNLYHGHGYDGTSRTRAFQFSGPGTVSLYVYVNAGYAAGGVHPSVWVNRNFLFIKPNRVW